MMVRWFACVFVIGACTHHRPLIEAHGLDTGTRVVAQSHHKQVVTAVVIEDGLGVQFHAPGGVLPPDEIAKVTEVRRLRGAFEGLGIGAGIGAGAGALIGIIDGDDECSGEGDCFLTFTRTEKAILGGVMLGVVGAGIGLLVGAVQGSTFVYSGEVRSNVSLGGPPGSVAGMTVQF